MAGAAGDRPADPGGARLRDLSSWLFDAEKYHGFRQHICAFGLVSGPAQLGRLVALDLFSGNRVWEANMAGASTPWVAGDYVYAMSDAGQLVAFARDSGKIRWINQLPRWGNEKKKTDPIFYAGPVMAGGRLFVAGTNGALIEVRPSDGTFLMQREVRGSVRFQPVVAGGTLLLLADDGRLTAFR